jgi:hypothetical protein
MPWVANPTLRALGQKNAVPKVVFLFQVWIIIWRAGALCSPLARLQGPGDESRRWSCATTKPASTCRNGLGQTCGQAPWPARSPRCNAALFPCYCCSPGWGQRAVGQPVVQITIRCNKGVATYLWHYQRGVTPNLHIAEGGRKFSVSWTLGWWMRSSTRRSDQKMETGKLVPLEQKLFAQGSAR